MRKEEGNEVGVYGPGFKRYEKDEKDGQWELGGFEWGQRGHRIGRSENSE